MRKSAIAILLVLLLAGVAFATTYVAPPPGPYTAVPFGSGHLPAPLEMEGPQFNDPWTGFPVQRYNQVPSGAVTYQAFLEGTDGEVYRMVWSFEEVGPPPVYYEWIRRIDRLVPPGTWVQSSVTTGYMTGQ